MLPRWPDNAASVPDGQGKATGAIPAPTPVKVGLKMHLRLNFRERCAVSKWHYFARRIPLVTTDATWLLRAADHGDQCRQEAVL